MTRKIIIFLPIIFKIIDSKRSGPKYHCFKGSEIISFNKVQYFSCTYNLP